MARAGDELVNPITGERIVFRKTAADTDGTLLEMDDFWTQPGHRAPEHVHPARLTESGAGRRSGADQVIPMART